MTAPISELDFRVAKHPWVGSYRASVALDLLNVLNLSTILVPNQAFIPAARG